VILKRDLPDEYVVAVELLGHLITYNSGTMEDFSFGATRYDLQSDSSGGKSYLNVVSCVLAHADNNIIGNNI
jgi:hypothetical protein